MQTAYAILVANKKGGRNMPHISQQDYWNAVSEEKEFTLPLHYSTFQNLLRPNAKVLDIGCGYGRTLNELSRYGHTELYGIDFAAGMIARGKRLYPHLQLTEMKSPAIPFPDASFDLVVLFAVLTCIASNDEQENLLNEINRVLAPDGIVVVSDFLLNTDERNLTRYKKFENKYPNFGTFELPKGGVCRHHSIEWVQESLSLFEAVRLEKTAFTTMNGNPSNGYHFVGRKK